ncbi:MAG: hypothetical protein WCU74_00595 [Candidatus Omnitrophota bacterium]|jgi:hypothetical protein
MTIKFHYTAKDKNGAPVEGTAEAEDKEKALLRIQELREQGLQEISIDSAEVTAEVEKENRKSPFAFLSGKKCPYCEAEFDTMPKRSRKCLSCKEFVYVIKSRLFTKKGYENEKRKAADQKWGELNRKCHQLMKAGDWSGMGINYFQMALQLCKEKKDFFPTLQEAAKCQLRDFQRNGIKRVRIMDAGVNSCPACQKQGGKIYSIRAAMEGMFVPCKDCTFGLDQDAKVGWCRCEYVPE